MISSSHNSSCTSASSSSAVTIFNAPFDVHDSKTCIFKGAPPVAEYICSSLSPSLTTCTNQLHYKKFCYRNTKKRAGLTKQLLNAAWPSNRNYRTWRMKQSHPGRQHPPKRPPSKAYLVQGICWYSNRGVLSHGINLWVLLVLLRLKHKVCPLSLHHHQHLLLRIILQHILEI